MSDIVRDTNSDFEELMHNISNHFSDQCHESHSLVLNGCFWSMGSLLRKNNNNLRVNGDVTVSLSQFYCIKKVPRTKNVIGTSDETDIEKNTTADQSDISMMENIIKRSKSWSLPIVHCLEKGNRIMINIDREIAFKRILNTVYHETTNYGSRQCVKQVVSLSVDNLPSALDLSSLRLSLTKDLLVQIMKKQGYTVTLNESDEENCIRLHLTLTPGLKIRGKQLIVCGVVRDSTTQKKETLVCAETYQRLREKDMEEALVHKYGSYSHEALQKGFISSLAKSAVTLDLLHSKISQPVSLDLRDCVTYNREKSYKVTTRYEERLLRFRIGLHVQGHFKGELLTYEGLVTIVKSVDPLKNQWPQFLLYNYARLTSILKQFDEFVKRGIYPPLVSIAAANFSLLTQEEEWMLLFDFIMPYPALLTHSVNPVTMKIDIHVLIQFLQNLCICVSAYYSRVRILTEPRTHLLPLMYSRIYLIIGVKQVMLNMFQLFNIDPVSQM